MYAIIWTDGHPIDIIIHEVLQNHLKNNKGI